jgi:hypothetical protein
MLCLPPLLGLLGPPPRGRSLARVGAQRGRDNAADEREHECEAQEDLDHQENRFPVASNDVEERTRGKKGNQPTERALEDSWRPSTQGDSPGRTMGDACKSVAMPLAVKKNRYRT